MLFMSLLAPLRRAVAALSNLFAAAPAAPPGTTSSAEASPLPNLSTRIACRRDP